MDYVTEKLDDFRKEVFKKARRKAARERGPVEEIPKISYTGRQPYERLDVCLWRTMRASREAVRDAGGTGRYYSLVKKRIHRHYVLIIGCGPFKHCAEKGC